MSNDKVAAARHDGTSETGLAVTHLLILYEVVCDQCGWEAEENPFYNRFRAEETREQHRCKT